MKKLLALCLTLVATAFSQNYLALEVNDDGLNMPEYSTEDTARLGGFYFSLVSLLWLSHKHDIPILLSKMPYAQYLNYSAVNAIQTTSKLLKTHSIVQPRDEKELISLQKKAENTIFLIDVRMPLIKEYRGKTTLREIGDDPILHSKSFTKHLRDVFLEKTEGHLLPLDPNTYNIAIHYRVPSGPDEPCLSKKVFKSHEVKKRCKRVQIDDLRARGLKGVDIDYPDKFPPLVYYAKALKELAKKHTEKRTKVYVFTTDPEALAVCDYLKSYSGVPWDIVHVDSRSTKVPQDLYEMFSLSKFDALIRPENSRFSQLACLLTHFKFDIFPKRYRWFLNEKTNDVYFLPKEIILDSPKKRYKTAF